MRSTLRFALVAGAALLIQPPDGNRATESAAVAAAGTVATAPEVSAGQPDPVVAQVEGEFSVRTSRLTGPEIERLAVVLVEEARRHELPVELVLAVIQVESAFNPFAVSPVGAIGLMQVLPSTGAEVAERLQLAWHGGQTLFDPETNVRIGIAYLKELQKRYGSVSVALAAYNWGPGRIDRRLRVGHPLPVVYASRVLDVYDRGFPADS